MTADLNGGAPATRGRLEFGIFIAPWHDPRGNPTLQFERDLQLIELAEELGFAEAWVGEHMSNGHEIILSPEVFLAAAAMRTKRIRLATGVSSLPYHHPFTLANRMVQLDHLSRGRAVLGIGPGQLATDAVMMNIDPKDSRRMMVESAEVITRLLRGEPVSTKTDWFATNEARLQILPHNPDGLPVVVASVVSPTGSTLAGRLGHGMISMAASDIEGYKQLDTTWANYEQHAAEAGHTPDREDWRVVGTMHLAETAEQARQEVLQNLLPSIMDLVSLTTTEPPAWLADPETALDVWMNEGFGPLGGRIIVGTPDDALDAVRRLEEKSGGFGKFVLLMHNAASWEATKRSLRMFAEYVVPALNNINAPRQATLRWFGEHNGFSAETAAAIAAANAEPGAAVSAAPKSS